MWEDGEYKGYIWEAKVYQGCPKFGINNGRVSKLHITKDSQDVYCYDRGLCFDKLKDREVLDHILSLYLDT